MFGQLDMQFVFEVVWKVFESLRRVAVPQR
jgi:hypothetical protein